MHRYSRNWGVISQEHSRPGFTYHLSHSAMRATGFGSDKRPNTLELERLLTGNMLLIFRPKTKDSIVWDV